MISHWNWFFLWRFNCSNCVLISICHKTQLYFAATVKKVSFFLNSFVVVVESCHFRNWYFYLFIKICDDNYDDWMMTWYFCDCYFRRRGELSTGASATQIIHQHSRERKTGTVCAPIATQLMKTTTASNARRSNLAQLNQQQVIDPYISSIIRFIMKWNVQHIHYCINLTHFTPFLPFSSSLIIFLSLSIFVFLSVSDFYLVPSAKPQTGNAAKKSKICKRFFES